jgi:hypothetical protein
MLISALQIDLDSLAPLPPKYFTHRLTPVAERLPMRAKASRSRPPPLLFINAQHSTPVEGRYHLQSCQHKISQEVLQVLDFRQAYRPETSSARHPCTLGELHDQHIDRLGMLLQAASQMYRLITTMRRHHAPEKPRYIDAILPSGRADRGGPEVHGSGTRE